MANHVYFYITSEGIKEDTCEVETVERDWGNGPVELTEVKSVCYQPFMKESLKEHELDEDGWPEDSWNWHVEKCGAKWVQLEDSDEGYLQGHSAWSPPIPMLGELGKYLKADMRMTYEDEFRNFIGVAWSDDEGNTSYEEIDGEEITEALLEKLGLEELPEDFDWWDEQDKLEGGSSQEFVDYWVEEWFDNQ